MRSAAVRAAICARKRGGFKLVERRRAALSSATSEIFVEGQERNGARIVPPKLIIEIYWRWFIDLNPPKMESWDDAERGFSVFLRYSRRRLTSKGRKA